MAILIFLNNYPSAVDNYFIYSLLIYLLIVGKGLLHCSNKKKKNKHFKIQHEFSDRCSNHGLHTLLGGAKVSCILRHLGIQLILAYTIDIPGDLV